VWIGLWVGAEGMKLAARSRVAQAPSDHVYGREEVMYVPARRYMRSPFA
jgi:hypothetical protein